MEYKIMLCHKTNINYTKFLEILHLMSAYLWLTDTVSLLSSIHAIRSFITYNVPSPFLKRTWLTCIRTSSDDVVMVDIKCSIILKVMKIIFVKREYIKNNTYICSYTHKYYFKKNFYNFKNIWIIYFNIF